MTKKLKVHKAMMCIHALVFMASGMLGLFCIAGIKYSEISNGNLIIAAVSQFIICAYSAHMAVVYEKSIKRIKGKLNK